nr:MAG TPA: nuclear disruption protein [Inoviridae sp.]
MDSFCIICTIWGRSLYEEVNHYSKDLFSFLYQKYVMPCY